MGRTRKKREVIEEGGKIYFICTKCGEKKEATSDNFGKYKYGYLGLSASCKNCLAKNMRERMANNPEGRQKRIEYLSVYNKKNKDKRDKWKKDNRELILKRIKEDRKNNPEKWKARDKKYYIKHKDRIIGLRNIHNKTNNLINKLGVRPSICPMCGKETIIVSHHPDYSKYNEIVRCCNSCHQHIHRGDITEFKIVDLLA